MIQLQNNSILHNPCKYGYAINKRNADIIDLGVPKNCPVLLCGYDLALNANMQTRPIVLFGSTSIFWEKKNWGGEHKLHACLPDCLPSTCPTNS